MDDLDRLFHQVVRALAGQGPNRVSEPFQIAELYQELVPYRHHRSALRLETHQDYEMAVLRLLAGERGYARVEPADVQDALASEAQAALPNTGAFREFAAARVHLNSAAAQAVLVGSEVYAPPQPAAPPEPELPEEESALTPSPAVESHALAPPPPSGEGEREGGFAAPAEPTDPGAAAPEPCPYCGAELPAHRTAYYCPFCGGNVKGVRCPDCGTDLEVGWSYCLTCGKKMGRA